MHEGREFEDLLIYKKAWEIMKLTQAVVESIDEEEDQFYIRDRMMENAHILPAKIAAAEGGDLYNLRMECATFIKVNARELLTSTSFCKLNGLSSPEYLQLLRDEIGEFKKLFLGWVNSFDPSNNIDDGWGLFI